MLKGNITRLGSDSEAGPAFNAFLFDVLIPMTAPRARVGDVLVLRPQHPERPLVVTRQDASGEWRAVGLGNANAAPLEEWEAVGVIRFRIADSSSACALRPLSPDVSAHSGDPESAA